jgi:hypothetical protein
MFICIGKRKGEHGAIVKCTNQSEVPSRAARPDWGFLCQDCLDTRYGRAPLHVDAVDFDKPNHLELDPSELYHGRVNLRVDESEQEELDNLNELDLS